jgi:hypothetical protein
MDEKKRQNQRNKAKRTRSLSLSLSLSLYYSALPHGAIVQELDPLCDKETTQQIE